MNGEGLGVRVKGLTQFHYIYKLANFHDDTIPMIFTVDSYFPTNFVMLGVVSLVGGIILILMTLFPLGLPLVAIGIVLVTTRKGTLINQSTKTIKEFIRIGGFIFGDDLRYETLHYILVREENYSQTMSSRGSTSTVRYTKYNAYLLLDDDSILLTGGSKQDKVVDKMTAAAKELGIDIRIE